MDENILSYTSNWEGLIVFVLWEQVPSASLQLLRLECETRRAALKEAEFFQFCQGRSLKERGPGTFLEERSLQTKDRGRETRFPKGFLR